MYVPQQAGPLGLMGVDRDPSAVRIFTVQLPPNSPSEGKGANRLWVALWRSDCPKDPANRPSYGIV